jgi:hypothetical protein
MCTMKFRVMTHQTSCFGFGQFSDSMPTHQSGTRPAPIFPEGSLPGLDRPEKADKQLQVAERRWLESWSFAGDPRHRDSGLRPRAGRPGGPRVVAAQPTGRQRGRQRPHPAAEPRRHSQRPPGACRRSSMALGRRTRTMHALASRRRPAGLLTGKLTPGAQAEAGSPPRPAGERPGPAEAQWPAASCLAPSAMPHGPASRTPGPAKEGPY